MKQNIKIFLSTFLIIILSNISFANESFFGEGLKLYKDKKYDEAKFLFERSIVFNPKNSNSYLYLAKIYNYKKDEKK